jgi:hypothetical protein
VRFAGPKVMGGFGFCLAHVLSLPHAYPQPKTEWIYTNYWRPHKSHESQCLPNNWKLKMNGNRYLKPKYRMDGQADEWMNERILLLKWEKDIYLLSWMNAGLKNLFLLTKSESEVFSALKSCWSGWSTFSCSSLYTHGCQIYTRFF